MPPSSKLGIALDNGESGPIDSELERKYGARLNALDTNGDGFVDRSELLSFIRDTVDRERKYKNLKLLMIVLSVLLLLFALTTFGTVWAVVALTEKISTSDATGKGSDTVPALVSRSTGDTLRTAMGYVNLQILPRNESDILAYENFTLPPQRRRLAEAYEYLGRVAVNDVAEGCKLLLEGKSSFMTFYGSDVMQVNVISASAEDCRKAINYETSAGFQAHLSTETFGEVYVLCAALPNACSAFQYSGTYSSGRRLASLENARGLEAPISGGHLLLSFGPSSVLKCAPGQRCERIHGIEEAEYSPGRGLLGAYTGYVPGPDDDYYASCFHPDSVVHMEDGTEKPMHEITIGDRVLSVDRTTGDAVFSPVYVLPHAQTTGTFHYNRITTASNHTITATPDHYLFISNPAFPEIWSKRLAVPAAKVMPGDAVWVLSTSMDGSKAYQPELTRVIRIEDVIEKGIFAPLPLSGTVVADGVVASAYSTILGEEETAHAFCSWGRLGWRIFPEFFKFMHARGWGSPTAMAMGYSARFVLRAFSAVHGQMNP